MQKGIEVGACNTMLLKVNQVGTISDAFDAVQFAYDNGYGVMPCESRGEGADIADYCVGMGPVPCASRPSSPRRPTALWKSRRSWGRRRPSGAKKDSRASAFRAEAPSAANKKTEVNGQ